MSIRSKHALQAAVSATALLLAILLYIVLTNSSPGNAILIILQPLILTFITTLACWWIAFPANQYNPFRAVWIGVLVVVTVLLVSLMLSHGSGDDGPLANGGSTEAVLVLFFGMVFVPVGIIAALVIRWLQTKKANMEDSAHNNRSFMKTALRAIMHLLALSVFLLAAWEVVLFLTNDFVGRDNVREIRKIGYQLNTEIQNYHAQNGTYPKSLNDLPAAASEKFPLYRRWHVFRYQAWDGNEYQLIWSYSLSSGTMCSNTTRFWPGKGSMRTENYGPLRPNSNGCYDIDPNNIHMPPLVP